MPLQTSLKNKRRIISGLGASIMEINVLNDTKISDYASFAAELGARKTTCRQAVETFLTRISAGPELNAFLEVYADEALEEADRIDQKIKAGTAGKLAGMVLGVKDVICQKDKRINAGSKILGEFRSLFTSTALQRLLDEDAIVLGRLNCDEFAMGSSNENSAFGPCLNPINTAYVPGGSSGGSAAAVCAGLCHVALGSDTGGSVRQPAAFCGLIGVKPTYGRVSRYGLIAYASSFDQIGVLSHTIEDSALVLEVMAGFDDNDNTSSSKVTAVYSKKLEANPPYKIALIEEAFQMGGLDPEIQAAVEALETGLRAQGCVVDRVSFPFLDYLVSAYYVLTTAEASSNLSRYDGVRYGYRAPDAKSVEDMYVRTRATGFGKEVKRRIMLGAFVLSAGYYDAYYQKAQKVRRLVRDYTNDILSRYDVILSPTTPETAFKIGEKSDDPISMYLSDIFTVHANLTGHPALALPLGTHSNGLPFGMQILGNYFEEEKLFQVGAYLSELNSSKIWF